RVRPVNTRVVMCFSESVRVAHDWMSLDSGTFSGSQKLPVSRSQTSASLSSSTRFQLMAETRLTSFSFPVGLISRTPSSSWSNRRSEHARNATVHLGALERELAQADVVDRVDALAPRVDLGPVEVARGRGVLEEQRQGKALVHVLGG